ncbi:hypothetical protein OE09_0879 [Flavobacteriaceae bacterium MAR_2010_72]|nr:hypothetical protein OE09_0879 [Flavobacteriaceae bacterium MAR_2010_72]TVZ60314.1 hypothetical protein NA63_2866 [Flavobacteriaceae bacterium MAR_2010_105]
MIKFFRKIRYNLMETGKTGKYLKYAIGEIVLVVIGILIALQINTWNEAKKTSHLETKILKELHSNLTLDLEEIQSDVRFMDSITKACTVIKDYLKTHDSPEPSVFNTFSILRITPHFDPNMSGYGLLQSKGVEVISNDSLRNQVSLLYERTYPYYKRYEEERLRFHALHSEPILLNYFNMYFDESSMYYGSFEISQDDYDKLKTDAAFTKLLSAIAFENSAVHNRGQRTERSVISLLQFLEDEIERKAY